MKRILIIDDDCFHEEASIREGFAGTEIELFLSDNKDDALRWIESKALFDCIVLDWYLEPDDPNLSLLILKKLEKSYYAPVLIYSAHAENFRGAKDAGEVSYPDNLIHEVAKGNFTDIRERVEEWLTTDTTAKLSNIYIDKVYENIHRTFWDLNGIPHGNIAAVYRNILFDGSSIDWANDFVINLLLQKLVSDESFRTQVIQLVQNIQEQALETTKEQKTAIVNKILYFRSTSSYLSTADIVEVEKDGEREYGVIVSPDCDLAQCKTKYVEFVEVQEFNDAWGNGDLRKKVREHKDDSYFYLPGIELIQGVYSDFVAIFKSKNRITCCDIDGAKYPCVTERIKYDHKFRIDGQECSVKYVCSLLNPYRSEFSHKRSTHDGRVGIPEVFRYLQNA